jgi:hypothetical protein
MKKILYSIGLIFIISGCGGGDSSNSGRVIENSANFSNTNKEFTINRYNQVERIKNSLNSTIKLHIQGRKDIYAVVTSHFPNQNVSITTSNRANDIDSNLRVANNQKVKYNKIHKVAKYRSILNLLHKNLDNNSSKTKRLLSKSLRVVNDISLNQTESFCINMNSSNSCTQRIDAQVKKIVRNVQTPRGVKSLVIWLESGNSSVSQSDIDKLADIFLKSGENNDIYDWVTNVYGSEWGDDAKNVDKNLIDNSNIIDILLYRMNNNALAGYFWGKDNFKNSAINASNEKIMFYINTNLLRINPEETYTTLGHEFQHMIHFYQRAVLKDLHDSTWLDELMSETTEDLIATKIKYKGPRNVSPYDGSAGDIGNRGGRYPTFNRYNTASLTNWSNITSDYSKVSAFGTYLLRNYGGAKMLNRLMYSDNTDKRALIDATGEGNFYTLISNWGAAVILSDKIGLNNKFEYNFGDFKHTNLDGIDYKLGSINFFNYTPKPQFKSNAILDDSANLYYKVGSNLSGDITLNIKANKGVDITIIAK